MLGCFLSIVTVALFCWFVGASYRPAETPPSKYKAIEGASVVPTATPTESPQQRSIRIKEEKRRAEIEYNRLQAAQKRREAQAKVLAAQKARNIARLRGCMVTDYDEVEGIVWYEHATRPNLDFNNIAVYFGRFNKDTRTGPLRFKFHYHSDDWLFIEKLVVKVDDEKFEIPVEYDEVSRNNNTAGIFEAYDVTVTPQIKNMLDAVVKADRVILRAEGKDSHDDFEISEDTRQRIKEVMELQTAWE
jgi:hypothetical protein